MDLRGLRLFVAVVDAGSLPRAAAALSLAQPALTAQVRRLESVFGLPLLDYTVDGVRPTAAGERLYQDAQDLLKAADAIGARIGTPPPDPEGAVTLAVPIGLTRSVLAPVLIRARERYPRIRLDIVSDVADVALQSIIEGRAELGVVVDPPETAGLLWRPLAHEPFTLAGLDPSGMAVPLLQASWSVHGRNDPYQYPTIRFADAVTLPLLFYTPRMTIRRRVQQACDALGIKPNIVHEHDSSFVLEALYAAGAGFVFVPSGMMSAHAHQRDEFRARVVEPEFDRTVGLAWQPSRRLSPAALTIVELVRAEVAQAIGRGRWVARHVDREDYRFV
jgi:LysR family transcriptional regulator, nitrogen assimilation regulatory protein